MAGSPNRESSEWNLYAAVGSIVAQSTRLEHALTRLLGTLLDRGASGWAIGRGERYSALIGMITRVDNESDAAWKQNVADFCKDADALMRKRDAVVHSDWLWLEEDARAPRATRHTRSSTTVRKWSEKELTRLGLDLVNTTHDIKSLAHDIEFVRLGVGTPEILVGRRIGDVIPGPFEVEPWPWAT